MMTDALYSTFTPGSYSSASARCLDRSRWFLERYCSDRIAPTKRKPKHVRYRCSAKRRLFDRRPSGASSQLSSARASNRELRMRRASTGFRGDHRVAGRKPAREADSRDTGALPRDLYLSTDLRKLRAKRWKRDRTYFPRRSSGSFNGNTVLRNVRLLGQRRGRVADN